MHEEAYVAIPARVLSLSSELHENSLPIHIHLKVGEITKDLNQEETRVQVGETLSVRTWGLEPKFLLEKGDKVLAYLNLGFIQNSEEDLVPYYSFVTPNGLIVEPRPAWRTRR